MSPSHHADVVPVTSGTLRSLDLRRSADASSKHERGRVLIAGGSRETPGAMVLAATAALRAGAGVVQVATAGTTAAALAVALPETRVVPLPESGESGAVHDGDGRVRDLVGHADAVLVGSGAFALDETRDVVRAAIDALADDAMLVLDAAALDVVREEPGLLDGVAERVVLMPNATEAARMIDVDVAEVTRDTRRVLERAVKTFGTVVAVRTPETWVAGPGTPHYCNRAGHPLLGVSGSGDVLAGVLVGLASQGCAALVAALSAVHVHARAGARLARRGPATGRLARELLDELPALLETLARDASP
jgi:hydroxyethylthiazole kinase-like uncharacterized protein yjeF